MKMGRGKIGNKKIENPTNLQVTFSKRRSGIIKKAKELSVLCDAQISLIMCSSNTKFHEFVTPTTTQKKLFDRYQKAKGIDLWHTQYERMHEELRKLRDTNHKLQRAIRQRMGKDLHDMSFEELFHLEETMKSALDRVFIERRKAIQKKTNTLSKKVKSMEKAMNPGMKYEELVEGDYQSEITMEGWGQLYTYQFHPAHLLDPISIHIP